MNRWAIPFALLLALGLVVAGQAAVVPAKAVVAQVLLDRAFDRSVREGRAVKPWSWADTAPVARIRAPRLGVSQVVLSGGSGQAMAFGPTLLPGGGEPGVRGTAVYAAHRDTHFRFLKALHPGDELVVEGVDGRAETYRVTGVGVVRKDRFGVDRTGRTPSIALTTCWPFGAETRGPWRYVVRATRVGV